MFNFMRKKININQKIEEFNNSDNAVLLDVRTSEEYNEGHIKNSENIPLSKIENYTTDKQKTIYVYCRSGARSGNAARILASKGYNVINAGGIIDYSGEVIKKKC